MITAGALFWTAWLGALAVGALCLLAVEVVIAYLVWSRIWRDP